MPPILILKTGSTLPAIAREFGDFEDWIIAVSGAPASDFRTVAVHEGESLPGPASVSGVIVTGSPAMVTEDAQWIRRGEEFLRDAVNGEVPVLGICFGHQMLAQALGGDVAFHPRGREIGTTSVKLADTAAGDPLFAGFPEQFPAHVTHMQSVMRLPAGATLLAGNDFDPHQGVRFAGKAWGVQFHPEFNARIMSAYIRERAGPMRREGLDVERLAGEVREAEAAAGLLGRFVSLAGLARDQ